ncbi:hypothetical protein C2845_PM15G02520 [Panicum miliaceum]|uniref:Uncharacterized protein n=1 Tax=Panicum miliaceum TaxID=4540 RepID=A0A3L6Q6Y9_PANMI|nr:hypothetical protein C2845_PM15G02520 [Panicum miliaceum]
MPVSKADASCAIFLVGDFADALYLYWRWAAIFLHLKKRGKRIGIPNGFFGFKNGTVKHRVCKQHIDTLRRHGATVIGNLDIANLSVIQNISRSGFQAAALAEFKFNLNNYLSNLSYSPVRSLAEIIAFNNAHPVKVSSNIFLTKSRCTF